MSTAQAPVSFPLSTAAGSLRLRCHVSEFLRGILAQEAHAARAGQHQVGFEVVIEVHRQN